jgi:predicted nucleic acid-binding protein
MNLFLDTSVLLSACGSAKGASRFVCVRGKGFGWELLTSVYCRNETLRNIPKLGNDAVAAWNDAVEPGLRLVTDVVSLEKVLVFEKAKDRPVLVSALAAQCEVLLTLDRTDFHNALGSRIYGMKIRTPAEFLLEQRASGAI